MVSIGAGGFVAIACLVFVAWRVVRWRSAGGDAAREGVAGLLFLYLVAVGCVTFFPMTIIFYDWHGRFSFAPLASIAQLVLETDRATALKNIAGNVVMFVPLGVLLPLLFQRLRSFGALVWRVALISLGIELLQLPTRVRATDVDDILLNVVGALIGYALFRLLRRVAPHSPRLSALIDRSGAGVQAEPLLAALLPLSLIILLTLGLMVPRVLSGTLSESAMYQEATRGLPTGSVAARAEAGGFVVLVAKAADGSYMHASYERVLPGRYTKLGWSDVSTGAGSRYSVGVTAYNPTVGESPLIYIVGRNDAGASTIVISSKGRGTLSEGSVDRYFAVVVPPSTEPDSSYVDVVFRTADGRDVTDAFRHD